MSSIINEKQATAVNHETLVHMRGEMRSCMTKRLQDTKHKTNDAIILIYSISVCKEGSVQLISIYSIANSLWNCQNLSTFSYCVVK